MNIFYLDENPKLAAEYQCNKHVVKMVLESAQLLSTNIPLQLQEALTGPKHFYRPTHANHPCSIWVRTSAANFDWLLDHSLALAGEYQYRYGKVHKSLAVILSAVKARDYLSFTETDFTTPALAMPDKYKTDDPVESYRNYYRYDKLVNIQCTWTKRNRPQWL